MKISELIQILDDYRHSNGDKEIIFFNEDNVEKLEYSCMTSTDEPEDEDLVVINFINSDE